MNNETKDGITYFDMHTYIEFEIDTDYRIKAIADANYDGDVDKVLEDIASYVENNIDDLALDGAMKYIKKQYDDL